MSEIKEVDLPCFKDDRGTFQKLFNSEDPALRDFQIKQINQVQTKEKEVLRGLHYQDGVFAESKLFKVTNGRIQLVAFCVNKASKAFLKSHSYELTSNDPSILIPRGFATGYLVMEANSEVLYFSDNVYEPKAEKGIAWNDPHLKIDWLVTHPILSEKDKSWETFHVN